MTGRAREVHPYLRTVLFYDDSFMAIRMPELTDFATQWREQVGLSFCIYGVIPTYVQREKVELLTWAGMNRVRMGIQSGSDRILKFYKRPTPVHRGPGRGPFPGRRRRTPSSRRSPW